MTYNFETGMFTAVRQRSTAAPKKSGASHLDTPYGFLDGSPTGADVGPSKAHASIGKQQMLANMISRKNAIYYIPILLFFYVVGPTAVRIPSVLYIWASKGFVMEHLLGAGVRDFVGNMVKDPHQLMVGDVVPPTPLAAYKDIILEEYLEYRKTHDITILSKLDPDEQGPLDTKGVWKTLFLQAMNRYADHASLDMELAHVQFQVFIHRDSFTFMTLSCSGGPVRLQNFQKHWKPSEILA